MLYSRFFQLLGMRRVPERRERKKKRRKGSVHSKSISSSCSLLRVWLSKEGRKRRGEGGKTRAALPSSKDCFSYFFDAEVTGGKERETRIYSSWLLLYVPSLGNSHGKEEEKKERREWTINFLSMSFFSYYPHSVKTKGREGKKKELALLHAPSPSKISLPQLLPSRPGQQAAGKRRKEGWWGRLLLSLLPLSKKAYFLTIFTGV